MQLTRHTDFALRSLMYLAGLKSDQKTTITEIAVQFEIPRNHLTKVVNQLSRVGYVESSRGPKGGIKLKMPANQIDIASVVKHFEATLDPINCDSPECPARRNCRLKAALLHAQNMFLNALEQYTIADMLKQPSSISELILVNE